VVVQPYAAQKLEHLLRAEDDGEFLWHLGSGDDSIEVPLSAEGHVVKETQCRHGNDEGAGRQLFLLGG
jgi:hypothetical protein